VARLAADHGLAFAAIRVIVDPAHRTVPAAALAGMRPDGRTDPLAVLRALVSAPSQALALMRVASDVFLARNALQRGRRLLGPGLGFAGLGFAEASAHSDHATAVTANTGRRESGLLSGIGGNIPASLATEKLLA
jgi:hypothetical protein